MCGIFVFHSNVMVASTTSVLYQLEKLRFPGGALALYYLLLDHNTGSPWREKRNVSRLCKRTKSDAPTTSPSGSFDIFFPFFFFFFHRFFSLSVSLFYPRIVFQRMKCTARGSVRFSFNPLIVFVPGLDEAYWNTVKNFAVASLRVYVICYMYKMCSKTLCTILIILPVSWNENLFFLSTWSLNLCSVDICTVIKMGRFISYRKKWLLHRYIFLYIIKYVL